MSSKVCCYTNAKNVALAIYFRQLLAKTMDLIGKKMKKNVFKVVSIAGFAKTMGSPPHIQSVQLHNNEVAVDRQGDARLLTSLL